MLFAPKVLLQLNPVFTFSGRWEMEKEVEQKREIGRFSNINNPYIMTIEVKI